MNDSIRRFLESMVEDGTPMEDVLNEVANTATEMKAQEDRKEIEIHNFLENAAISIAEAVKLIDPDLVPIVKKSLSAEVLEEVIEYIQTIKDFLPSGLLDDFLTD